MKDSSGKWVIRSGTDQAKGPYSTDAIKQMILNGDFSGGEEICSYPEGEWRPLAKQSEFYDALLESLENPAAANDKKTQKMEAETVIRKAEPEPTSEQIENPPIPNIEDLKDFVSSRLDELKDEEKKSPTPKVSNKPVVVPGAYGQNKKTQNDDIIHNRDKNFEIVLTDLEKLKQQQLSKIAPLLLLVIIILGGALYYMFNSADKGREGWSLIAPQKKSEEISEDDLKNYKRKAVKAFQSGSYEMLLSAQRDLVRAVEGAPKDLEAIGLLCVAYEQLWPYTKQTQNDIKSIITVTQLARNINPISNYSETCQSVLLLTKGQSKEARSLIEKSLDTQIDERFSLGAFLYLMKAEILESENNYVNAEAYYDQAVKLWPQWITARFGLARVQYKQNKFAEAREQYVQIYNENKEYKAALYGLGLIEVKGNNDSEKAVGYFASGFELRQQMPKDFLAEAMLSYAKILLDKNDTSAALKAAEAGYKASPSHRSLREMVVSLGGTEKMDNAQSEIILIGDQFARAGDHMVAQAQYKAAFDLDSKNATAAYKAAKSLWQINQTREAINWLEKSIQADPNMLQSYVLKADYESQKYNFASAVKTLQTATRRFPKSHEVLKAQALLEFRKNNMAGAIQYGERAVKIYNADVELLTLLAQAYTNVYLNAPTIKKADQDAKNNSKELAQRYAGRAIDLEPAWPESQITYSKILAAVDGPVRGETYLKELIKTFPYTIEYRIALAEFYRFNEKFSEAATIYEEVVSIDGKNKKAMFGLAETYRVLNKEDLALKYYTATSVLDPTDVEAMFANAKLLIETASGNEVKAKIENALAKLQLVKKVNPDFPKASYLMAKCYLELNNYDKAMEMISEEKSRNPFVVDSYILAAEMYFRKSQFKECAAEYSAAIKMRPNSAELYVKSSICYRKTDSMDIAEDMLAIALQKESGYADIYREYGYILERKGFKAQAIQSFQKYLLLSPNAADREAVQSKISQLGG